MDTANPYAAPEAALQETERVGAHYGDATKGQRLANLFVDYVGGSIFGFVIAFVMALAGFDALFMGPISSRVFGIGAMFGYYLLFETLTGRTLGKLITRTKVIADTGGKPNFMKVLGRTASRLVPFEAFSFLGDNGWHDSWSGTRVVRLTPGKWQTERF